MQENVISKEVLNGDLQAITNLFDGGNRGSMIPSRYDIVEGRLGDAAHIRQLIDGDAALLT